MTRLFLSVALVVFPAFPEAAPRIFPQPQEMTAGQGAFALDGKAVIALPANASPADRQLAAFLSAELADRWGLGLRTVPLTAVKPGERAIVMGAVSNATVRGRAAKAGWRETASEGYLLDVSPSAILIAGADDRGAFYGLQSLRQLIGTAGVPAVRVRDWPRKPFRAIKLYLPGRDNIGFFKRFVRDFAALHKFNKLVLEMNAGMRLDRHPELNAGWIEFARDLNYSRRERSRGARGEVQDSAHHDTADGGVLEKEEVADLVRWARLHHMEVIPEVPALTHCYYLLTRHRELAEYPESEWPDTYCPSLPGSRKLYFEVVDEFIDVMKPAMVHIGHDEWRMPWGHCPRCRDRHYGDLFGENVRAIHAHLTAKGVRTAMWADHLIERLRGKGPAPRKAEDGHEYVVPGGLTPEQVRKWIPRDILMFNWFWNDKHPGQGEVNDAALEEWGFQQVYGNMEPGIPNYDRRANRRGLLGGAPSSWAATTEFNIGKDLLYQFLGTAAMLWSGRAPAQDDLPEGGAGADARRAAELQRDGIAERGRRSRGAGEVRRQRPSGAGHAGRGVETRHAARGKADFRAGRADGSGRGWRQGRAVAAPHRSHPGRRGCHQCYLPSRGGKAGAEHDGLPRDLQFHGYGRSARLVRSGIRGRFCSHGADSVSGEYPRMEPRLAESGRLLLRGSRRAGGRRHVLRL